MTWRLPVVTTWFLMWCGGGKESELQAWDASCLEHLGAILGDFLGLRVVSMSYLALFRDGPCLLCRMLVEWCWENGETRTMTIWAKNIQNLLKRYCKLLYSKKKWPKWVQQWHEPQGAVRPDPKASFGGTWNFETSIGVSGAGSFCFLFLSLVLGGHCQEFAWDPLR